MRKILMFLFVAAASVVVGTPAYAVVGGQYDSTNHPQTGLVVNGDKAVCSSVLIAPRIVATAGYCTEVLEKAGGKARVTFDSTPGETSTFYTGVALASADYTPPASNTKVDFDVHRGDYGAIVLDQPVKGIKPLALPDARETDTIDFTKQLPVETGYGLSGFKADGTPIGGPDERKSASLVSAGRNQNSDAYLLLGDKNKTACIGDAGGPAQLGSTVLAIAIGGDDLKCGQWAYFARMDIPEASDFYGPLISAATAPVKPAA